MKVKFNTAAFAEALNLVTSIIPARTPKEILKSLRITAQADTVILSATDLEVGIRFSLAQVEVLTEGDVIIPADKVAAIIRETTDEVIEMEAVEAVVHIKGADSHFTIYGHDPEQYPDVPGFEGEPDFQMTLEKLQRGIELTVFAAARESTRYALNGILWEVAAKKLTLVATDGRRLAKTTVPLNAAASAALPDGRIIVPAKTMTLLDKISSAKDDNVSVKFVDNQIILAAGNVIVSSNLVEGNFPKYDDIIPKDHDKKIPLQAVTTLSAVRRAALLANEDSKGIKIALTKGAMTFSSRAPETGDAQVDMAVEYDGPDIEIGFNPQFLVDVLRVIKTDALELHLGQSDRPGLIKAGPDFVYIVMPVNL